MTLNLAHPVARIAILGGGYTGAIVAMNLARHADQAIQVTVIEPRAWIGGGVAYSTPDPAHRVNSQTTRMSVDSKDQLHFDRWIRNNRAIDDDSEAALPDGRIFPRRLVFGTYVREQLARCLRGSVIKFSHVRDTGTSVRRHNGTWVIATAGNDDIEADLLVITTSHPAPAFPRALAPISDLTSFIADPGQPGSLEAVAPNDRVLIVGTGLSMADIVASLDGRGHCGPIIAVSRHGLVSREHANSAGVFGDFASAPPSSSRQLVRRIRSAVEEAAAFGLTWQTVFDALRRDAPAIWAALAADERSRLVRHLRTFWDVHRFRLPPQTGAILERRRSAGDLRIVAASIQSVRQVGAGITLDLRPRGATGEAVESLEVDRVILATGPGHGAIFRTNGAIAALAKAGYLQPDALGLGILVDERGAPIGANGTAEPDLFVAGPLARGSVGELMGVPQVTRHAEQVAKHALAQCRPNPKV